MIESINNEFLTFSLAIIILSLFLDLILGELPNSIHPVVIIGKIISFLTNHLIKIKNKLSGLLLVILTVFLTLIIFITILFISTINLYLFLIISILILSSTFSVKLLLSSANDMKHDLIFDIEKARASLAYLVSRNTKELDEEHIISATIESLSENIVDSYISPIFYLFIGLILLNLLNIDFHVKIIVLISIPLIYRVVNTLDAMVGYKNEKYSKIGFVPAKTDDILNFIPSRISGILIVIVSFILNFNWKNSYKTLLNDSKKCPSPNSGYPMSATAGALGIQLIKENVYIIGNKDKRLDITDITYSINLIKTTIYLFTLVLLIITILVCK